MIKWQNHLGWERPLGSSGPTISLTLPSPPLNPVYVTPGTVTQPLHQAACFNAVNSFREEIFPTIQSKPPLTQPEAVSSCPISFSLGGEPETHPATPPLRQLQRAAQSIKHNPVITRLPSNILIHQNSREINLEAFCQFYLDRRDKGGVREL